MDGAATEIVGGDTVADLRSLERWWNDPGIAAWSFVLFGCFLLNATLLLAFLIRPGLRTISNRFVMNLTVSNLLTCIIFNPLLIMDTLSPLSAAGTNGGSVCAVAEAATALVTTSSVLSVLLIAVDQYFAVMDPLRYRARVDKLKSGILIVSVWIISVTFGFLAFFNPHPRSFWLSCSNRDESSFIRNVTLNSSLDSVIDPAVTFLENVTDVIDGIESERLERTVETIQIENFSSLENGTLYTDITPDSITYGLVYAIVHSVFAYLLPFAGVCWIYVSIYVAAHRNSERTRRTGSRPMLSSSASFTEEQYAITSRQQQQYQQECSAEDFRRIPKISSLSSIDETSETTQSAGQPQKRRSFSSSSEIVPPVGITTDDNSSGVVFTVGSQRVEVSPQRGRSQEAEDLDDDIRVPATGSQPEFLEGSGDCTSYEDFIRRKFREEPEERGKSREVVYEGVLTENAREASWMSDGSSDGSTDSENEARFGYFDSVNVNESAVAISCKHEDPYFPRFSEYEAKKEEVVNGEDYVDAEESSKTESEESEQNLKLKIQRYCGLDVKNRRSSVFTTSTDVTSEGSNSVIDNKIVKENVSSANGEPSACLLTPIVTITPAPSKTGTLHRVSSVRSTSSYINSLKHRISNGSLFRYREETRAARISALVIVMGLICWSPYVILLVIKNVPRYYNKDLPHEYDVLVLSFLILAAYISPLLFGYRSRRVKRELRKFFCFRRELSYKNNRSLMAKKVLKRRHSSTLSHLEMDHRYNIFNCVYGRSRWPKEKVQFVQVPDTALAVETCRSSFSSGASTQISSTSTEEC